MHYLNHLPNADLNAIQALLQEKVNWLAQGKKGVEQYRQLFESVHHIKAEKCDFSGDVVKIGSPHALSGLEKERIYKVMRGFMPWRKGPFEIFGIEIDA
jgi:tRNA (mo5U34)-methyltransferase